MSEKPLTLASLNIRGLGGYSPKQKLIKTWISSLENPPYIVLLQEHHLDVESVSSSTKGIEF
jgi:hypothetical protein